MNGAQMSVTENIVGKGENAAYIPFFSFPITFSKAFSFKVLRIRDCGLCGKDLEMHLCLISDSFQTYFAKPYSSVGTIQDLKTGGRWFDP